VRRQKLAARRTFVACLFLSAVTDVYAADETAAAMTAGFNGSWSLACISDGRRARDDRDERLDIVLASDRILLNYTISDQFGRRTLVLRAPLNGSPLPQSVDGRPAVLTAAVNEGALILAIEREASFGRVHNRRTLQLRSGGQVIESTRSNLETDGSVDSQWHEIWIRQGSQTRVVASKGSCSVRATH